ncbi:hypothetical protein BJV74DRAFT_489659 [Russula compacta]|nr:hypothetical protein BJV74DRAFT_489659 [Russula compacta]
MTISTDACSKLGLLHHLLPILLNETAYATQQMAGKRTLCCGYFLDTLTTIPHTSYSPFPSPMPKCRPPLTAVIRCTLPPMPSMSITPSLILYRPAHLYVCAQYSALSHLRAGQAR